MTHYLMVAKLSKKCFDLVLKIPQRINRKVTQGDFIHPYKKSEEEQHKILSDLLDNRISHLLAATSFIGLQIVIFMNEKMIFGATNYTMLHVFG